MPSHPVVLRSILTLPSHPCTIHSVFLMPFPTHLVEWLNNTCNCTSLECGHPGLCSWFAVTTISCILQRLVLWVLFYSNSLPLHNFLFINHSQFYYLFNQRNIYKSACKYMSLVLPSFHPASYRVVAIWSDKPG
jgi:hypothetical protein